MTTAAPSADTAPPGPPVLRRAPSVLILTRNEEANIAACLECFRGWTDDAVVLDSMSTDRTVEIARSFPNVRVVQRAWDTEYKQRNFGLTDIAYRNPWVYICDADERIDQALRDEISAVIAAAPETHAAYRLRYRNMFMGRWIKRSSGYPVWIIRLVRPDRVRYEIRETNVHPIADGEVGELRGHFIHYSFNAGLRRWFEKHNYYSDREATEALGVRRGRGRRLRDVLSRDPMRRRRAIKNLSFLLKARALWRFLYHYVGRLGVLDGPAGLHYCLMISLYEYWLELKVLEVERKWADRDRETVHRLVREIIA